MEELQKILTTNSQSSRKMMLNRLKVNKDTKDMLIHLIEVLYKQKLNKNVSVHI